MKNNITPFLKEKMLQRVNYTHTFPVEEQQFIIDYGNYYDLGLGTNLKMIFTMMKRGITEIGICEYTNCTNKQKVNSSGVITRGCCKQHSQKITNLETHGVENPMHLEATKEKMKNNCFEKYGVSHSTQRLEVKEKQHQTMMERYGFAFAAQVPEFKAKQDNTILEKYGVINVSSLPEIKAKKIQTCLANFGVEYPSQSSEVRTKIVNACMDNYGVHNVSQSDIIKERKQTSCIAHWGTDHYFKTDMFKSQFRETSLLKYGTEWPSQSPIVTGKIRNTCYLKYGVCHVMQVPEFFEKSMISGYRKKEFVWLSGDISIVQGYEDRMLSILEAEGLTWSEVLTAPKDLPSLFYSFEGTTHRYYPDIFIPSQNLIIEVKSTYTVTRDVEKNKAKFQSVIDNGFEFRLEVI